ncbi:TPA: glycosyltransferase family 2 protein [Salmonella enterica]|uniref:Glycosyltransferase n=1 Tax=Salmonella enterica TaxID=28901 RepID=U3GKT1_SALER|nr:glycosyltransferase [Salmonella enterica]HCL5277183.1 glycosyltransferase family 2 protein [Salmonella enterica]
MSNKNPDISVLLPAYNCEKYIGEAIDSILNQSFSDFELIIINDCSTDNTDDVIKKFLYDKRIRYYINSENLQLVKTLNKGLELCRGKYIARMDADDIAFPSRLMQQIIFLESNNDYVLIGTEYVTFGAKSRYIRLPHSDVDCRSAMLTCSPFCHPSTMFRREIIDKYNLKYDTNYMHAEDYKFFSELAKRGKVANIGSVLLKYRVHDNQITKKYANEQMDVRLKIIHENNGIHTIDMHLFLKRNILKGVVTEYFMKGYLELLIYYNTSCSLPFLQTLCIKSGFIDFIKFLIKKIAKK